MKKIDIMNDEQYFLWAWNGNIGGLVGAFDTMDAVHNEINSWKIKMKYSIVRRGETVETNA